MAKITGILCQIITGNRPNAGTDGSVFLGLGGREFRLDSSADDYERSSWREYVLGEGPVEPNLPSPQIRVNNRDENDPRIRYPLDSNHLDEAPVYIRFEPESSGDMWDLSSATVLVYAEHQFFEAYMPYPEFDHLWMGNTTGKVLYLTDKWRRGDRMIFAMVRDLAERIRATPHDD